MTAPRVAVIGSCTSRDCFNRLLAPDYRRHATIVDSAFQTAFPSLIRRDHIGLPVPARSALRPRHKRPLAQDFHGANLDRIVTGRPDVLVVDLFADVHFGCVDNAGRMITRNHMAFASLTHADSFFDRPGLRPAGRLRPSSTTYDEAFLAAVELFVARVRRDLPDALIVLNQARRAHRYRLASGATAAFGQPERIDAHNAAWLRADSLFAGIADPLIFSYPPETFLGSVSHPWGLHPVHYTDDFYHAFWHQLTPLLDSRAR
jgi:hypothetical protein